MERLRYILPETAPDSIKEIYKKFGMVFNIFSMMGNSEIVIGHFTESNIQLKERGRLSKKIKAMIYLAVPQFNNCDYCLAFHSHRSTEYNVLTPEECLHARNMSSPNRTIDAILHLVREILEKRGHVGDSVLKRVRKEGFDDEDIMEVVATISLAHLANYTANIGLPELDFPEAPPL